MSIENQQKDSHTGPLELSRFNFTGHVFLDYDDTMALTESLALKASCDYLNKHVLIGLEPFDTQEYVNRFAGSVFREIVQVIAEERGLSLTSERIDQLALGEEEAVLKAFGSELSPTPNMMEVLDILCKAKIPLSVVSSSSLRRLQICLKVTGQQVFIPPNQVFSAQSTLTPPKPKPLPDIYLHAIEKSSVKAENCVAIEDSISGVKSASAAGLVTLGYLGALPQSRRAERRAKLLENGASRVFEDMSELPGILIEISEKRNKDHSIN